MRRAALLAILFVAFLFASTPAHAQEPIIVDLRIETPGVVTVGDRVRYTVVAEVDAGTAIALAPSALPPELELVNRPQTSRIALADGREQVTITFEVAPFIAGDIFVPSLPLRYTAPDGSAGIVEAFSSVIAVTSVLPEGVQVTARDLKPQAEFGTPPATWPLPAFAALITAFVLLILAALVRRAYLRYQATCALERIPVFSGPEDMARGMLDHAGREFAARGDYVTYYTAIGNAVRHYLTSRYEFPAFAMTTRELEAEMLHRGLDRWQIRVAGGLLAQCDAVVYARYRPAAERADADLTAAYEIVEMSRPVERPVSMEEVAVS